MAPTGIGHQSIDREYFTRRGPRRHAGVASLWAEEAFVIEASEPG
jgi:hypothetical protein